MKSKNRAEVTGSLYYFEELKNGSVKGTLRYYTERKVGKPYENIRFIAPAKIAHIVTGLALHTTIRVKGMLRDDGVILADKVMLASDSNSKMENAKNRFGYMPEDELPW
jgi:hypothetical protein